MDALLLGITLWLFTNFHFPANFNHPRIEFAPSHKIDALRYRGVGTVQWAMETTFGLPPPSDIVSIYDEKARTAQSDHSLLERTIRQLTPKPARCSGSPERFFSCRHETPPEHSLVLELAFGKDGPSASLTHNFDHRRGRDFMTIMRTYFSTVGVEAKVFDECIWRSLVSSDEIIAKDFELGRGLICGRPARCKRFFEEHWHVVGCCHLSGL